MISFMSHATRPTATNKKKHQPAPERKSGLLGKYCNTIGTMSVELTMFVYASRNLYWLNHCAHVTYQCNWARASRHHQEHPIFQKNTVKTAPRAFVAAALWKRARVRFTRSTWHKLTDATTSGYDSLYVCSQSASRWAVPWKLTMCVIRATVERYTAFEIQYIVSTFG